MASAFNLMANALHRQDAKIVRSERSEATDREFTTLGILACLRLDPLYSDSLGRPDDRCPPRSYEGTDTASRVRRGRASPLPRSVPIRALALRANARRLLLFSRDPLVLTAFATVGHDREFDLRHGRNMYPLGA